MPSLLPMYRLILLFCWLSLGYQSALANNDLNTIRGQVVDRNTKSPIPGVRVELTNFSPPRAVYTNEYGRFKFEDVPLGRHRLMVQHTGYQPVVLSGLELGAGAELNLLINLDEVVEEPTEENDGSLDPSEKSSPQWVLDPKDRANNEMEISAIRLLSTAEVNRFAGDRNDISRMIANYAGMYVRNDHENHLSIRGNSPRNMQWRLEGLPISTACHLGELESNGGIANVFTPYVLDNSDLVLGTPSAEYMGATAGFFDVQLRPGNNERFQLLGQVSTINGAQAVIEGPFSKDKKAASYLISARFTSTPLNYFRTVLDYGTSLGQTFRRANSYPILNDLLWNFHLPNTRAGTFSIFGIMGNSEQNLVGDLRSATDKDDNLQYGIDDHKQSFFWSTGIKHLGYLNPNKTAYWQTTAGFTLSQYFAYRNKLAPESQEILYPIYNIANGNIAFQLQTYINHKISPKLSYRVGAYTDFRFIQAEETFRVQEPGNQAPSYTQDDDLFTSTFLSQGFAEALYRPNNELSINLGLGAQHYFYNNTFSVEPRLALSYRFLPRHKIYLAYAHMGQLQPISLIGHINPDGSRPYVSLPFLQSHNGSLGYTFFLAQDWRLRLEGYAQYYYNVPTDTLNGANSTFNFGNGIDQIDGNDFSPTGKALTLGGDFTLEKFFDNKFYFIFTGSYVSSKTIDRDGKQYSSAFDVGFIGHVLVGREFKLGKSNHRLSLDLKSTFFEGEPIKSVDSLSSRLNFYTIYNAGQGFSERLRYYWRVDFKVGLMLNGKKSKLGHRIYLDFINILNWDNPAYPFYNFSSNRLQNRGNFPVYLDLTYQIRF